MYEVNADNNRGYRSRNARHVAEVAHQWQRIGINPKAYTVIDDDGIRVIDVPIRNSIAATTRSLINKRQQETNQ